MLVETNVCVPLVFVWEETGVPGGNILKHHTIKVRFSTFHDKRFQHCKRSFFIDKKNNLKCSNTPRLVYIYTLLRVPTVAPSPSSDHPQLVSVSVYTLCCCPLAPVSPPSTLKEGNSEVKKLKNGQISAFCTVLDRRTKQQL